MIRSAKTPKDPVCPPAKGDETQADLVYWPSWSELFSKMVEDRCNLLRLFLTNGTAMSNGKPTDLFPYRRSPAGKLNVKAAVEAPADQDRYNSKYFDRLSNFALAADQHDIALQLCLFNHFDFVGPEQEDDKAPFYRGWSQSIWNPEATTDAVDWGKKNLVNVPRSIHTSALRLPKPIKGDSPTSTTGLRGA